MNHRIRDIRGPNSNTIDTKRKKKRQQLMRQQTEASVRDGLYMLEQGRAHARKSGGSARAQGAQAMTANEGSGT